MTSSSIICSNLAELLARRFTVSACEEDILDQATWAVYRANLLFSCYPKKLLRLYATLLLVSDLMLCEAHSIDTSDRDSASNATVKADAHNDLRTQKQTTSNSTLFANLHSENTFAETSYGRGKGTRDQHDVATEVGDGTTDYTDDSRGNSFNNADSTKTVTGTGDASTNLSMNRNVTGSGSEYNCHFNHNYYNSNQEAFSAVLVGVEQLKATSEGREYLKTSHNETRTKSASETERSLKNDNNQGVGDMTHTWQNIFQADTKTTDRDLETRTRHTRVDALRHKEAQASGAGNGLSESKSESHNANQGTAKGTYISDSITISNKVSHTTTVKLSNSQRFRNLSSIYDNTLLEYNIELKRLRAAGPLIACLPCCECSSCHANNLRNSESYKSNGLW